MPLYALPSVGGHKLILDAVEGIFPPQSWSLQNLLPWPVLAVHSDGHIIGTYEKRPTLQFLRISAPTGRPSWSGTGASQSADVRP